MTGYTVKRMRTGEFTTSYLDSETNGELVILLHGGGPGANAASNWRNFLPGLAGAGYHVVAPDIRGWGQTDHPAEGEAPSSMTEWMRSRVDQILAVMDGLGVEKAHLLGNSAGGALALWITQTAPERVIDLTLMGSAGGQMAHPTPEVQKMVGFYKDATRAGIEALTKWFVYDESILGDDIAEIVEERFIEVHRPEVKRSFLSMYSTPMSPAEMTVAPAALRRIDHRVLLIHGREDRFITPDSSIYYNQHLPNSQVHILPNCGHWAQIEKRDEMLALTKAFLAREI